MVDPTAALALLLLLGAWVALDGTSFAQVMLSRPIVAGTVAGGILGDAETGFLVGALLEAAHLGAVPAGAARLAEPGPAAIPAAAAAVAMPGAGGLAVGVGFGLLWSLVAGATVVALRRMNGRVVARLGEGRASGSSLAKSHLGCVALDGLRGVAVVAVGLAVVRSIPPSLAASWPAGIAVTVGLLALPGAFSGGALLRRWTTGPGGRARGAALLTGGLFVGWILAVGTG